MVKRTTVGLLMILSVWGAGDSFAASAEAKPEGVRTFQLADLYRIALDRAEQIKIAADERYIAEQDKERAFAVLVPSLAAYGNYTRYSESGVLQPDSSHYYGVKLSQSFTMNGSEITAYQAAKDQILQKNYDLDSVKEGYLFQVTAAYYALLRRSKRVDIAKANVERLRTQQESVNARMQLEDVPVTELYRIEAEYSRAKTALIIERNGLQQDRATLARLVELPDEFAVKVPDDIDTQLGNYDLAVLKREAFAERTDFQSMQMESKIAQSMVDISKGAYWPRLSVEGGYQAQDSDPTEYTPDDDSLYVALNLEFLLYDWGRRRAEVSQARARMRQAELRARDEKKQISVEVEQAYFNLVAARSSLDSLKEQLKFARASYEARNKQFQQGLADSVALTDANTVLLESEQSFLEAQFGFALAASDLERSKGTLLKTIRRKYGLDTNNPGPDNRNGGMSHDQ